MRCRPWHGQPGEGATTWSPAPSFVLLCEADLITHLWLLFALRVISLSEANQAWPPLARFLSDYISKQTDYMLMFSGVRELCLQRSHWLKPTWLNCKLYLFWEVGQPWRRAVVHVDCLSIQSIYYNYQERGTDLNIFMPQTVKIWSVVHWKCSVYFPSYCRCKVEPGSLVEPVINQCCQLMYVIDVAVYRSTWAANISAIITKSWAFKAKTSVWLRGPAGGPLVITKNQCCLVTGPQTQICRYLAWMKSF